MAEFSVMNFIAAVNTLYSSKEEESRKSAEKWLDEFQQSKEAWQISDSLLHDINCPYEVQYFCAQTLRTKVRRDFEELPVEASNPLRDSLLALLLKFKQGPSAVRTQLCLALADLAAHAASWQWGEGLGVVRWLGNLIGCEQDAIAALLELVTVIPQEMDRSRLALRPERRRQFLGELTTSVPDALVLLEACLKSSESPVIKCKVLEAFGAWIRYGSGIATDHFASNPLVLASLDGINSPETFDAAIEAVCELIRYAEHNLSGLASNMALVELILNRATLLRPKFSQTLAKNSVMVNNNVQQNDDLEEDEEVVKGLARLFAEMGEAFVTFIASGTGELMWLVEVLAEITSNKDYAISSSTFNFWHCLSDTLTNGHGFLSTSSRETALEGHDHAQLLAVERKRKIDTFKPIFGLLANLVSFRVQYPPNYLAFRKDELADFKRTRYDIADLLLDIALVYGGEALLQLLAEPFFKEIVLAESNGPWDPLKAEAYLYCIRGIREQVPKSENIVLPKVLEALPRLPSHHLLLYTASLTVAAYSDWLGQSSHCEALIPPILNLLTGCLTVEDSSTQAAAAMAFKHVCEACGKQLVGLFNPLHQLYEQVLRGGGSVLDPSDVMEVIEGFCLVVSSLPVEQSSQVLQVIIVPISRPLQELMAPSAESGSIQSTQFTTHLDRLACVFRHISLPFQLASLFQQLWPTIQQLFRIRAADAKVMEQLGRVCKNAIRSCKEHLEGSLGPLVDEVQLLYAMHKHPCCLYVTSEIVKIFGNRASLGPALGSLIVSMFEQTTQLLPSLEEFTKNPDVADDCFLLASRCIRYCPQLVVPTTVYPRLISCAMAGILIQHREACTSLLSFLKDSLKLPLAKDSVHFRAPIEAAIVPLGQQIVLLLLAGLMGALPESRVDDVIEVMLALMELEGSVVSQWASAVLSLIPASAISDGEKMGLIIGLKDVSSLAVISQMEEICASARRSKGVILIVLRSLGVS